MVKQIEKPTRQVAYKALYRQVLVQVSGDDLRRNDDDPMLAIIEAFVTRATEIQRKAKGRREF